MDTAPSGSRSRRVLPALMVPAFLIFIVLVGLIGGVASEQRARSADMDFRRALLRSAIDMASSIHPELVNDLAFDLSDLENPTYHEINNRMQAFGSFLPNHGIYSYIQRDSELVFGPENYPAGHPLGSRPGTAYLQPDKAHVTIFDTKRPVVTGPHTDEYGSFVTALAPILDPLTLDVKMVIGVEIPQTVWQTYISSTKRPPQIRVLILIVLLVVGATLLLVKQHLPEGRQIRLRHLDLVLTAIIGLAVVTAVSQWIIEAEIRERRSVFVHLAEIHTDILRDQFEAVHMKLNLLAHLFRASNYVDAHEFTVFATPLIRGPEIRALGWIPEVVPERADRVYEPPGEQALTSIPFWIWDVTGNRQRMDAPTRGWPALYIKPISAQSSFLGFDHASVPALESAIKEAHTKSHLISSGRIHWPPSDTESRSLYFAYRAAQTQGNLQDGVITAVLDMHALLESAFQHLAYEEFFVDICFREIENGQSTFTTYYPAHSKQLQSPRPLYSVKGQDEHYVRPILAMGRVFQFVAVPSDDFFKAYPARAGRMVWLAGVMLTGLITILAGFARHRHDTLVLSQSEKKYRQLFSSMTSGFALLEMITDETDNLRDFRFMEINKAFEHHTGLQRHALLGKRMTAVMPDAEMLWLRRFGQVALEGTSIRFTHFEPSLNRYFEIGAYSPKHGQVATIFNDITDRKRAEEQLARREAMQKLLMEMAAAFINILPEDVDTATGDALTEIGRFTRSDRAFLFRYDPDHSLTIRTHEWCAEGISPVMNDTQTLPCALDAEWYVAHRKGELYSVPDVAALPAAHPLRDHLTRCQVQSTITIPLMDRNSCTGFIGFDAVRASRSWSDDEVALLKVLAQLLANAQQRRNAEEKRTLLEQQFHQAQKLESLGVLAGGIAHDFNNILTTILGNADLALQDLSPVSPARESLETIITGSRRAADLCHQMLAFAGKGRFVVDVFSINEVVREMLHLLESSISKQARFRLELNEDIPPVRGDPSQIRQIILNLVINASEALNDQDGVITIQSGTREYRENDLGKTFFEEELEEGWYVTLAVRDTGCGMDKETLSRIFDPFFSTKFTGRGLGLAAVMGIVHAHKGALDVATKPGRGSTFTLLLPASEWEDNEKRVRTLPAHDTWKGSGTILLVDDEPSIRRLGTRMLERLGFTVLTATDGTDALDVYNAHRDDVRGVILDLTMPRGSGEDTLDALKELDPNLPVILASGYSKEDLARRLKTKGFTAFIQKPYHTDNLREALRTALGDNA